MDEPKTVKGYISMMRRVEKMPVHSLKGYDKLSRESQLLLSSICAGIGNDLGELDEKLLDEKDKNHGKH